MIVLTATTDNLQAVLAGSVTTNQPQCVTSWRDITTTDFTPGRTVINTNNTTDVNIVAAPAASTQRVVDLINIYNKDTVAATITVKFDANGTEYILWKGSLAAGEAVHYVEGKGWQRLSDTGTPQVDSGSGGGETATTMGALINAAGAATPNNGDFVATAESGGLLKKITWTNVKAFLKTYFDTLYRSDTWTLTAKTSSYTVLAADHGTIFDNTGAGGTVTFDFNTTSMVPGKTRFAFKVAVADTLEVTASDLLDPIHGVVSLVYASQIGAYYEVLYLGSGDFQVIVNGSFSP